MFSAEAAAAFLRLYYPPDAPLATIVADREAHGGRGRWPVCQADVHTLPGIAALQAFIDQNAANNLYFAVNSCRPGLVTTPEEADVVALLGIPLDIDLPVGFSSDVLDDVLARVNETQPPPTYVVASGGGVQAGWCLAGPKPLSYLEAVQEKIVILAREFGGDHVQNPNRVMRLPHTRNVLNAVKRARGREPADAVLIAFHEGPSHRYEPFTPRVPLPPVGRFTLDLLDPEWRDRVVTGSTTWLPNPNKRSRSEAVWALCCHLVREGWPDRAILALLLDRSNGISAHVYDQRGRRPEVYAQRQVANARVATEKDFVRTKSGAIVYARMDNVAKALARLNVSLFYNEFSGEITWVNGEDHGHRPLTDAAVNRLRFECLRAFDFQPEKSLVFDTASVVAREATIHPVKEYLDSITWDGKPRLERWLIDHGEAEDTPYVRAVSRLFLLGAVARVYAPGTKFDEMLVLENPTQGTDKSSSVQALCPNEEWFTASVELTSSQREALETLSGKWIVEVAELSGIRRSEVEGLKAFLDKQRDRARLAYDRAVTERPRTCVFFGTTNSTRYLRDEQNRRFWPVAVGKMNPRAIARDRDQLWAEAVVLYRSGAPTRLDPSLWEAAAAAQDQRRLQDPWLLDLAHAFRRFPHGRVLIRDLYKVIGIDRLPAARTQDAGARVGAAMRELGWQHRRGRDGLDLDYFYMKGETSSERRRDILVTRDVITNEVTARYRTADDDIEDDPERPVDRDLLDPTVPN